MKKKRTQTKLFIAAFAALAGLIVLQNLLREKVILLDVPNNPGVSGLETIENSLVGIFQDGKVVSWDWDTLDQTGVFKAASDKTVLLDAQRLAAVNTTGKKMLTVYGLPSGEKQKDLSVGWEDQEVWLRISPDKKTLALIRRNTPSPDGKTLFEFLTVDLDKDLLSPPATLSMDRESEFVDFAVDNSGVLYAVGSQQGTGTIAALNLHNGNVQWESVLPDTKEFCSVIVSPDNTMIYAGNRDGILYKVNAETGAMEAKIRLLKDGETRPITNDTSVLNLAFSSDGKYFVTTINPVAYILKTESDTIVHTFSPADRLVSKIAFSPENQFIATSDIRAGYPIKIWPLPVGK